MNALTDWAKSAALILSSWAHSYYGNMAMCLWRLMLKPETVGGNQVRTLGTMGLGFLILAIGLY